MDTQLLRKTALELQRALDNSRALAARAPSGKWPVLLSDDRVAALIEYLTTLADEADLEQGLHQIAFRRIYWFASANDLPGLAALAIQFADLAAPPAP